MAKGADAKNVVAVVIEEVFGKNFLGIQDKKIYVLSEENGEPVQVAISLTCPKNLFNGEEVESKGSIVSNLVLTDEQKGNVEVILSDMNLI